MTEYQLFVLMALSGFVLLPLGIGVYRTMRGL